jgi:hypothetical protein
MSARAKSRPKARPRSSASHRTQIIAAAVSAAGVVLAAIVALAGGSGPSYSPSLPGAGAKPGPQSPVRVPKSPARRAALPLPVGLRVDPNLSLDSKNFCSWRFGIRPIPLSGLNPLAVRIDDRCNYPSDSNPNTDSPTGIYSMARQDPAYKITEIQDGTPVTLECITRGQSIADAVGNTSEIWIGVQVPDGSSGFIPDVNIGGGYTQQQLSGMGLSQCQ